MKAILPAVTLVVLTSTSAAFAQDAENSEQVFRQCRARHQVGDGAKNVVGPQLNGIVGRTAAAVDGFSYSEASKDAGGKGLVWSEEQLDKYLTNPMTAMPGTKMAYAGLKDEDGHKDLIAYLKEAGDK